MQLNGRPNRLCGATRLAGELVRDDQTTEQQAVWGDQDSRGAVRSGQTSSLGSWGQPGQRGGEAFGGDQANKRRKLGAFSQAGK